jgi:CDP-glucose 4,6-dehydratase
MSSVRDLERSYRGRKVLITGHTGFKGGWLALWLNSLGAEVHGLSLDPPTEPSFFCTTGLDQRVEWTKGDIRKRESIREAVKESDPEMIFHLAAQPIVRESYSDPIGTFETNILGTANVLDAVRSNPGIKGCLCITSDKCYENQEKGLAFQEADPMGGADPYSASKGAAEIVISSYRRSFFRTGALISSARAGNVIGGGDWAKDRLVPDCIRSLQKGETIVLRNPDAVRPWQHVLDPLNGYLTLGAMMLGDDRQAEGAWNFGPPAGKEATVEELVRILVDEWRAGGWRVEPSDDLKKESRCLRLDSTKARRELGWRSVWDVRTSVRRSVDWYRQNADGADMWKFSLSQIADFENDLRGGTGEG